jgi:hypothetical protein
VNTSIKALFLCTLVKESFKYIVSEGIQKIPVDWWCLEEIGGTCVQDAARYLEDVLTINGGDEDAAIALDQCFAELDQLRTVRR